MRHLLPLPAAAMCLLCACQVDPRIARPSVSNLRDIQPAACSYGLTEAIDARSDKSALGTMLTSSVQADGTVADWVRDALAAGSARAPENSPLTLRVELLQAYVHQLSTTKSADLVIRVHYAWNGQTVASRTYRGADTSTLWTASNDEIQGAFDRALQSLVFQVAADVRTFCS